MTKISDGLMQCPKRVLENNAHKLLILQAVDCTSTLDEKAYFFGRMALWHQITRILSKPPVDSVFKFFQVDITGIVRMTSYARYFKEGVGSSRPSWRWIMCFLEWPKANTSCNACVKLLSFS